MGGYYGLGGEACTDMLKQNNPVSDYNQFVFGSMPITTTSNMFDTWGGEPLLTIVFDSFFGKSRKESN